MPSPCTPRLTDSIRLGICGMSARPRTIPRNASKPLIALQLFFKFENASSAPNMLPFSSGDFLVTRPVAGSATTFVTERLVLGSIKGTRALSSPLMAQLIARSMKDGSSAMSLHPHYKLTIFIRIPDARSFRDRRVVHEVR